MNKLNTTVENYKGFINILFGIMLAVIGYLVVEKLNDISTSIKDLNIKMTQQLVTNEKFYSQLSEQDRRIKALEQLQPFVKVKNER